MIGPLWFQRVALHPYEGTLDVWEPKGLQPFSRLHFFFFFFKFNCFVVAAAPLRCMHGFGNVNRIVVEFDSSSESVQWYLSPGYKEHCNFVDCSESKHSCNAVKDVSPWDIGLKTWAACSITLNLKALLLVRPRLQCTAVFNSTLEYSSLK